MIWVLYGGDGVNSVREHHWASLAPFGYKPFLMSLLGIAWGLLWRVSVSAEQTGQTRNICAVQVDYSLHITHGEVLVMEVTWQHFYSLIGK